ncbi:MAG: CHAD domain-containing protein [Vicinamibacterales bacterium]
MSSASAISVANEHIEELLAHLPGIRDGESESIHQGRVATRRLREVLPLLSLSHPDEADEWRRRARKVQRRLGRVRELDVISAQLEVLEERVPLVVTIAQARAALRAQQERRRRRLIKALEKVTAGHLCMVSGRDARLLARLRPYATARAARRVLRLRIGEHAQAVFAAVERSEGLYFPNRVHAVRVAVKKLRYSVEVAQAIALWRPPRLLQDLGAIQTRLGAVHDQQVLLDALDELGADATRHDVVALKAVVKGDLVRVYERYVARIDRLRAICAACQRFASRPAPAERRGWTTSVTVVAAQVGLTLLAKTLVSHKSVHAPIGSQVLP